MHRIDIHGQLPTESFLGPVSPVRSCAAAQAVVNRPAVGVLAPALDGERDRMQIEWFGEVDNMGFPADCANYLVFQRRTLLLTARECSLDIPCFPQT